MNLASHRYPAPPRPDTAVPARGSISEEAIALTVLFVVGAIFAAAVPLMLRGVLEAGRLRAIPEATSATVQGIVTGCEPWSPPLGIGPTVGFAYRYTVQGESYAGLGFPKDDTVPACDVGSTLTVRYDSDDPVQSVPLGMERTHLGPSLRLLRYLALGLPFIAALGLVAALFARSRERALVHSGSEARGEIVAAKRVAIGRTRAGHAHKLSFSFETPSGERHSAKERVRLGRGHPWEPGTPVTVFYDPQQPRRAVAYEPLVGLAPPR